MQRAGPDAPERLGAPSRQLARAVARLLRLRIDGDDAARLVAADDVDDRRGHLERTAEAVDLSEQHEVGSLRQLLGPPRLVEECGLDPSGAVADRERDHRTIAAHATVLDPFDPAEDHALLAFEELVDTSLTGAVDVAPGVGAQQIEHRVDTVGLERLGALVPDAIQSLYIELVEVAKRQWRRGVGHQQAMLPRRADARVAEQWAMRTAAIPRR